MNCKDYSFVISCSDSDDLKLSMQLARSVAGVCNAFVSSATRGIAATTMSQKTTSCVSTERVTAKAQSSTERVSAFHAEILRCPLKHCI